MNIKLDYRLVSLKIVSTIVRSLSQTYWPRDTKSICLSFGTDIDFIEFLEYGNKTLNIATQSCIILKLLPKNLVSLKLLN